MQGAENQTRQWLWARRKFSDSPINSLRTAPSSSSFSFDSYKELNCSKFSLAADDPWSFLLLKSYDCSFCGREFQSAQALGGHMNVHRVDRAKMRLASEANLKPSTTLECKTNPNSSSSYSQSSEENCSKTFLVESRSMDLKLGRDRWKAEEMDYSKRKEFFVGYDIVSNKKQKKTADLMLALSFTSYEGEMEICKPDQVKKLVSIKAEELDLELRLGDPPKLKQISCNVVVIE